MLSISVGSCPRTYISENYLYVLRLSHSVAGCRRRAHVQAATAARSTGGGRRQVFNPSRIVKRFDVSLCHGFRMVHNLIIQSRQRAASEAESAMQRCPPHIIPRSCPHCQYPRSYSHCYLNLSAKLSAPLFALSSALRPPLRPVVRSALEATAATVVRCRQTNAEQSSLGTRDLRLRTTCERAHAAVAT